MSASDGWIHEPKLEDYRLQVVKGRQGSVPSLQ
jgi:hypothetical protein